MFEEGDGVAEQRGCVEEFKIEWHSELNRAALAFAGSEP